MDGLDNPSGHPFTQCIFICTKKIKGKEKKRREKKRKKNAVFQSTLGSCLSKCTVCHGLRQV